MKDNEYTPPTTRTVTPPERNSVVSSFARSTKEPIKFKEVQGFNWRTIIPPVEHLRTASDNLQVTDNDSMEFFTNYNKPFRIFVKTVKPIYKSMPKSEMALRYAKDIARQSVGFTYEESKVSFIRGKFSRKTPTPLWRLRLQRRILTAVRRIKND
jgi:hypothetical protein